MSIKVSITVKSKLEFGLLVWMTPTSTNMLVYSTKIPPKIIPKVIWDMILMIFINLTLVCSQRWYCKTTVHAKILGYWIAYCELCLCVCVCVFLFSARQVFLSRTLKSAEREREISSGYSLLLDWVLSDWSIC